jgi:glycerophosphoryl diester phosphodiesterase
MRAHQVAALAAAGAAIAASALGSLWARDSAPAASEGCHVVSHRGDRTTGFTEEGMPALERAVADGAEWLEVDTYATRDNVPYLSHDSTVDRTTAGSGSVDSLTAEQMDAIPLDDGSRQLRADEALQLAKRSDVRILLELRGLGTDPAATMEALAADIEAAGTDRVVVESISAAWLGQMKALLPKVETVLVTYAGSGLPSVGKLRAAHADGSVVDQTIVTDRWLTTMAAARMDVFVYVSNSPTDWSRFAGKVAGDLTDQVPKFIAWATPANCSSRP